MKRYGYLFEKITDIDNIKLAHKNARKKKTHYDEVKEVDKDIEKYVLQIKEMLEDGSYRTSPYEIKQKLDKKKIREIYKLPYYPDRIVHHAIMQVLEPIWKKSMIANTFQSIKGRGPHKAIKKLKKDIKWNNVYYLKIDIKKYYPSIDNDILKKIVSKKIKCKKTLVLLSTIIDSCKGVPIGNYISQYFGNVYLSELDHKVASVVNCKYYRYCDDIIVISNAKEILWYTCRIIQTRTDELKVKIKQPILHKISTDAGLDFLGYQMYKNRTLLRRSIKDKAMCVVSIENIHSYTGWLKYCDGRNLTIKLKGMIK
jgi:hypothetical protein